MADLGVLGDLLPVAASGFQQFEDFDIEGLGHGGIHAKFCRWYTQHFAQASGNDDGMAEKTVSQVLAEALDYFMGSYWKDTTLAKVAGISPNTIGNAKKWERRTTKSG